MPKNLNNPLIDVDDDNPNKSAKKIGTYKGNTIYDRGANSGMRYRYYMRGAIHEGFKRGPITACGSTLKELKLDLTKDVEEYFKPTPMGEFLQGKA